MKTLKFFLWVQNLWHETTLKSLGSLLFFLGLLMLILDLYSWVNGRRVYDKEYSIYWDPCNGDNNFSFQQRSVCLDLLVKKLNYFRKTIEKSPRFKTDINEFEKRLDTLKSLQSTFHILSGVDDQTIFLAVLYACDTKEPDTNFKTERSKLLGDFLTYSGKIKRTSKFFRDLWWKKQYPFLHGGLSSVNCLLVGLLLFFGIRYRNYGD